MNIMNNINRKEIIHILLKNSEYPTSLKKRINHKTRKISRYILLTSSVIFIIGFLLGILAFYTRNQYVMLSSLILFLLCEILIISESFFNIFLSRKDLLTFLSNPSKTLLKNVDFMLRADMKYISELYNFNIQDLKLVRLEINHEKDNFEKRTVLISGPIDKLGFFPAILATFVLILNLLSNTKTQDFFTTHQPLYFLFFALIFIVIFFQIFGIYTNFISMKLSHMIDILQYVIDQEEENIKDKSNYNENIAA